MEAATIETDKSKPRTCMRCDTAVSGVQKLCHQHRESGRKSRHGKRANGKHKPNGAARIRPPSAPKPVAVLHRIGGKTPAEWLRVLGFRLNVVETPGGVFLELQ
jgi:hypothetical protein